MTLKVNHTLHTVWKSMKSRCLNKNNKHYKNYGGRGITVCQEWLDDFYKFVSDMGERPEGYSIDRINNNGNYEPSNCRWANRETQQRNTRVTRKITIEGKEYIVTELAQKYGFKSDTIYKRSLTAKTFEELVNKKRNIYKEGLKLGGKASGAKKREATHCVNGHEFNEKNTSITKQGWRRCKECHRIRQYIRAH